MISKSERFLQKKADVPAISANMVKNISEYRREVLASEVERGLFRDGSATPSNYNGPSVLSSKSGMKKSAQVLSSQTPGGAISGTENTVRQGPEIYSPLWLGSNMNLPRDRATINAWSRSFFALQPFVANAINLHSTYPISKLTIKCPNRKVEKFFNEMIEEIDLMNVCVQVAQEYFLLGEAFVYAELDQNTAKWSRLVIQNPDYMVVKKSPISNEHDIFIRPDENLRRICFSNRPSDVEQRQGLNPTIIQHVKRGENIPLDSFYISHLSRKISPYEIRGTGLPVSCFRQLMLFDKLRESKFAQADNMINPMTLVKIGSADYKPTPEVIEQYRNAFEEAQYDKDFKLFTTEAVTVERVGYSQGIFDISGDITQLLKEIYMGLMVPEIILSGGGDISYANGGISLDVLRQRYMQFRNMMSAWLRNKIFAPISKLNDFYEYEDGTKKLVIPDVDWSHMSLFDTADYVNVLVQLTGDQKKVSYQTLYRSLGLEYEEERRKIKKEDIADAIRKKEIMTLEAMPLNELRALNEEDEINEIVPTALPGVSPYQDTSGTAGGVPGGADMGGGGLPPLPGLSAPSGGGGGLPPLPSGPSGPSPSPGPSPGGSSPSPSPK